MSNGINTAPRGVERRSGRERRSVPPATCSVPCKPIDDKLHEIELCVRSKTPQRLFYWAVGGIATFVVLVIGGAQWKLVDAIKEIDTNVKVMKVTVDNTKINLDRHMADANNIHRDVEKRLDDLEHKTYRLENGHGNKPN
ncbi:MAG: hypothetical protein AM326_01815 [Candidatus Thorarchaeota archaeon SMTZ-45]|nr:MAG: hypothetical protein AM326_01815 [Candidatus Thorarchaeota archaeon SMTZ-45]